MKTMISEIPAQKLEWTETLLGGKDVPLEEAEAAVAALGDGWRLPTVTELQSLVDYSRTDPAIDTEKFPDTKSDWYWTGTECAWKKHARWVVNFYYGYVSDDYDGYYACVRACRASQ